MAKSGTAKRVVLVAAVLALAAGAYASGLTRYFTLDALKSGQAALAARVAAEPMLATGAYFGLYVLVAAFAIPGGAPIMTLAGGALFGLAEGTLLVSFASTVGATLAFLASRF